MEGLGTGSGNVPGSEFDNLLITSKGSEKGVTCLLSGNKRIVTAFINGQESQLELPREIPISEGNAIVLISALPDPQIIIGADRAPRQRERSGAPLCTAPNWITFEKDGSASITGGQNSAVLTRSAQETGAVAIPLGRLLKLIREQRFRRAFDVVDPATGRPDGETTLYYVPVEMIRNEAKTTAIVLIDPENMACLLGAIGPKEALINRAISEATCQEYQMKNGEIYGISTFSWIGNIREADEDAVLFWANTRKRDNFEVLLADGMGGHDSGPWADIATRTIQQLGGETSIRNAIQTANEKVLEELEKHGADGGTTLEMARVFENGTIIAGHVGDSRQYIIRTNGIGEQITTDHSLVQRLIDIGQITPEQARNHPQRNLIYRSLGNRTVKPDRIETRINPGEALLVCCDGLSGALEQAGYSIDCLVSSALKIKQGQEPNSKLENITGNDIVAAIKDLNLEWDDNVSFVWVTRKTKKVA